MFELLKGGRDVKSKPQPKLHVVERFQQALCDWLVANADADIKSVLVPSTVYRELQMFHQEHCPEVGPHNCGARIFFSIEDTVKAKSYFVLVEEAPAATEIDIRPSWPDPYR